MFTPCVSHTLRAHISKQQINRLTRRKSYPFVALSMRYHSEAHIEYIVMYDYHKQCSLHSIATVFYLYPYPVLCLYKLLWVRCIIPVINLFLFYLQQTELILMFTQRNLVILLNWAKWIHFLRIMNNGIKLKLVGIVLKSGISIQHKFLTTQIQRQLSFVKISYEIMSSLRVINWKQCLAKNQSNRP